MSAEVAGTDLRFFRNGSDYEPYRQEDYQRVMGADGEYWKLGKLGPDLDTDELLRAKEKKEAIKEMDRIVRDKNRRAAAAAAAGGGGAGGLSKIDANKPKAAPSARDRALAFAKQVPKPEVKPRATSSGGGGGPGGGGGAKAGRRRGNSAHDEYIYGGGGQLSELEKLEMEHRIHQQKLAALAIN